MDAEEPTQVVMPTEIQLSKEERLEIENVQLKLAGARQRIAELQALLASVVLDIEDRCQIDDIQKYIVDLNTGKGKRAAK